MESIKRFVYFLIDNAKKADTKVVFESEKRGKSKGSLGKCPLCENNEIFENKKAFFCGNWKRGCRFTIWKNSLDIYGNYIDRSKVKMLLKDKKVENIPYSLPQTGERGTATLILNPKMTGEVELMNFKRDEEI